MINRILAAIFRWNSPDFVGSRRWWGMILCLFATATLAFIYAANTTITGLQDSSVRPFCRRACDRGRLIIESIDPVPYWTYIGMWAFGTVCCLVLSIFCIWAWLNRRKL